MTTDLLAELVAIDSVNPALVPGGAGEAEIAAFVAAWLTDRGLEVTVDEPLAGRPSVVGVARGSGGGASLMLNAHLDTVNVDGMERPHEPVIRDGRLYGRGAYDMKSGLAAIMVAGAAAARDGLSGDVIVSAVADEEHASEGVQSVLRRWRADACIVTEPTHLRACVAHKGFVWAQLETPRPRGARLAARPRRRRHRRHGPRARGHSRAAAPPRGAAASAARCRRACTPRSSRAARSCRAIPSAACWTSSGGPCRASPRRTSSASCRSCSRSRPKPIRGSTPGCAWGSCASRSRSTRRRTIVAAVRAAAARTLGAEPEIVGHSAWMDAAFLSAAGIPTVVFGPSGEGAHAVEEHVELESVEQVAEIVLDTARRFCA